MHTKKYKVTCLSCEESDVVTIQEANHFILDFAKKIRTNFLAGRYRADLQWGWECRCGNDNRLSSSEAEQFEQLVKGDEVSVERIARSLQIPDSKQFIMEAA